MKQIARLRMQDGNTALIRIKKNAANFDGPDGKKYNSPKTGEWGIEKTFWGARREALYMEGIPNPVGAKEIDALVPNGTPGKLHPVKVVVPKYEGFNSEEFTALYGEPIQLWLAKAIQRAQGGLALQYATIILSAIAALCSAYVAFKTYHH